jgi:hypothetical protein
MQANHKALMEIKKIFLKTQNSELERLIKLKDSLYKDYMTYNYYTLAIIRCKKNIEELQKEISELKYQEFNTQEIKRKFSVSDYRANG